MAREKPADYIKRWTKNSTLRGLARRAGVDHTTLGNYLLGRMPQLPTALRIANQLELEPQERAGWFAACQLEDPRSGELTYEPILESATIQAFREAELPPEDLAALNEEMRRLIAKKRRAQGYE